MDVRLLAGGQTGHWGPQDLDPRPCAFHWPLAFGGDQSLVLLALWRLHFLDVGVQSMALLLPSLVPVGRGLRQKERRDSRQRGEQPSERRDRCQRGEERQTSERRGETDVSSVGF